MPDPGKNAMDDQTRPSDYGDDVRRTETGAVATGYDPGTRDTLRRAVRLFVIVLVIAFFVVRAVRFFHDRALAHAAEAAAGEAPLVETTVTQKVADLQRFVLPGETAAWYTSTIYARVNGYVAHWYADLGDHVHKGQLLALIDTPEVDAQLAAARAPHERARADEAMRKAEATFAKVQYERWRDSPKGVVSEQEREQKHAEYDSAAAQSQAAQAQVALNAAQVEQFSALSQFKRVTAPFEGIITARNIDIGNLVTAGSTTATSPLYVMTQNDPMRVFVDVPQSAAADLMQQAVPVSVETRGGAARAYSGHVARTAQAINNRARTLRVEVDLDNADAGLVPGLYVQVAFSLPPRGLVQVPAAALLFRSGGPEVARIGADGRVTFAPVSIARDDGNVVELSAGVAPGDRLALNLSGQVNSGDLVRIAPAGAPHPSPAPASGS
jgi:RND family efflux transporter MFP subunit